MFVYSCMNLNCGHCAIFLELSRQMIYICRDACAIAESCHFCGFSLFLSCVFGLKLSNLNIASFALIFKDISGEAP